MFSAVGLHPPTPSHAQGPWRSRELRRTRTRHEERVQLNCLTHVPQIHRPCPSLDTPHTCASTPTSTDLSQELARESRPATVSCPDHLASRSTNYTRPSNTSRSRSRIRRERVHHGRTVRLGLRHLRRHQHGVVRGSSGALPIASNNTGKATAFATLASFSHFDEPRHGPAECRLHANTRITRELARPSQHQLLKRHHKSARRSACDHGARSTFAAQEGKAWANEPKADASAESHCERQTRQYWQTRQHGQTGLPRPHRLARGHVHDSIFSDNLQFRPLGTPFGWEALEYQWKLAQQR